MMSQRKNKTNGGKKEERESVRNQFKVIDWYMSGWEKDVECVMKSFPLDSEFSPSLVLFFSVVTFCWKNSNF